MCRPEKPISTGNKALRELQEWLREQRARAGQSYRTLAVRAGCHATTLQRAASSDVVPRLQPVLNYARACDASPEDARRLWKAARYEETRSGRSGRSQRAPRPEFIRDVADLSAALQDLYEKDGSPPLRTMEQRAGRYSVLPRSTAYRIINRQAVPHSLDQFRAYLRACEVPEEEWSAWETAWTRAWRHEKQEDDDSVTPLVDGPWVPFPSGSRHRMTITGPVADVDLLDALITAGLMSWQAQGRPLKVKARDPKAEARRMHGLLTSLDLDSYLSGAPRAHKMRMLTTKAG